MNEDLCPRVKWKPDCVRNPAACHPCIPRGVCGRTAECLMWPRAQSRANKPRSDNMCWQGSLSVPMAFKAPLFCSRFFRSSVRNAVRNIVTRKRYKNYWDANGPNTSRAQIQLEGKWGQVFVVVVVAAAVSVVVCIVRPWGCQSARQEPDPQDC